MTPEQRQQIEAQLVEQQNEARRLINAMAFGPAAAGPGFTAELAQARGFASGLRYALAVLDGKQPLPAASPAQAGHVSAASGGCMFVEPAVRP